jgi:ketosteroid isomerase-like protein
MDRADVEGVARKAYAAYADSDLDALEPLIADDFTFCSPDDPELDRAGYFERCWPNHEHIRQIRIEKLFVEGEEVFVRYELERVTGERFRNTEFLRVRDGQLVRAEVYYGASA